MEPTVTNQSNKAWALDHLKPWNPAQTGMLKQYLIYLPGHHPFWSHYMLGVCTLRDIPGVKPAYKQYPEAEYELLFAALHPEYSPDPEDIQSLVHLEPINYVNQFHGISDDEAKLVCTNMMQGLIDGELVAEPQGVIGARELWNGRVKRQIALIKGAKAGDA